MRAAQSIRALRGAACFPGEPKAPPKDAPPPDQGNPGTGSRDAREKETPDGDQATGHGHSTGSSTGDKRAKKPRPKHKEQWDRRLLSYVRKKQEESADADEQEGPSEHNLAVEVVARAAVCAYEKARGRVAEQMAQTHPGYDIISRNPLTGEDRFIEVKGVNGEWNQTGVGLSRLQFSNAQDYADRYWLYVVGETDFVVCHPDLGYVCIEVKGGGVGFDASSGDWFSVDRHHQEHAINNPVNQALKAKYSIRSKLNEHQRWRDLSLANVLRGHAVFFPDVGDANALSRPDMPPTLVGCAKDLQDPKAWIDAVFAYWGNDVSGFTPMGRRGVDVLRDVFARSFVVAPLISSQLADQEARRLVLTKDQIRVLDFLRSHRRVAVSGGAGTGKTVLALEKARRLASEGFRTLLTCYNRQLADHLSSLCAGTPNLDVMSFHQLCHRQVERANRASGRDLVSEAKVTYPGKDLYEVQLPNALGYSLEILPDRYDAIVCDEGQDFREEFWVPLELLLTDYDSSPLYVFYDDNQNLYARAGTFPIRDEPFSLTTNCRNTAPIHDAAYKHYKGVPVSPPDIQGDDVQFDESPSRDPQAAKINARIVDLVARQGVAPGDITVLVADALHKAEYYAALRRLPLPKPATWLEEGVRGKSTVLIDTIQRFKGLESPIVILWGLDTIDLSKRQELLYVGMSRAKSLLVMVGQAATCAGFK